MHTTISVLHTTGTGGTDHVLEDDQDGVPSRTHAEAPDNVRVVELQSMRETE